MYVYIYMYIYSTVYEYMHTFVRKATRKLKCSRTRLTVYGRASLATLGNRVLLLQHHAATSGLQSTTFAVRREACYVRYWSRIHNRKTSPGSHLLRLRFKRATGDWGGLKENKASREARVNHKP